MIIELTKCLLHLLQLMKPRLSCYYLKVEANSKAVALAQVEVSTMAHAP